jgi:predicted ATPase
MITELKIENFRGFETLELKGLQRVNLIVGENNAGKTSLLEAVAAAVNPDALRDLAGLFRSSSSIILSKYFRWLMADRAAVSELEAVHEGWTSRTTFSRSELPDRPTEGYKTASKEGGIQYGYWALKTRKLKVLAIPVLHRALDQMVPAFANAVRSPENERRMEQLLAAVDPRIRNVRLDYADNEQFIAVDLGLSERVPLSQAGQGIYRLVSIFSDLLGDRPDVVLIDEIENGIHYTVLKQVWQGIAEIAAALDIQVFATTHSRECLEAANRVFVSEDAAQDRHFALIQLMRVRGKVIGRVLDEERVNGALEIDIELR